MSKKRILSGMRPTGKLHLGHLVGALENWNTLQKEYDCYFMVADWHALMSEYKSPGGISEDTEQARDRFRDSISRLDTPVRARKVPLLIEATNRYESAVVNSLQDAADSILGFQNPYLRVLPDTFHMNIEERSMLGALIMHRDLYDSLHISDNNRFFPGLGAIDFFAILRFLNDMGYSGGIAIEGNTRTSFEEDLRASMRVLRPMLLAL